MKIMRRKGIAYHVMHAYIPISGESDYRRIADRQRNDA